MAEELREDGAVQGAGDIAAHAPEHPIDIINGERTLKLNERIQNLHRNNRTVNKLIESGETEKISKEIKVSPQVRYQIQEFNNGEGEGQATDYEKWRREKVDAGRKHRLEVEANDLETRRAWGQSSYERGMDHSNTLDGQIDDFLADYIRKYGELEGGLKLKYEKDSLN
jgi:hypothetical protein